MNSFDLLFGFCCVDHYHQVVSGTHPSSDGQVRLRMKYNTAVLRSRRLQKQIAERSLTSLPAENVVSHSQRGRSDDFRRVPGTGSADSESFGTQSYHRYKESTHGIAVPSDCQRLYSKPVTDLNTVKTSAAASRKYVRRPSDTSLQTAVPFINVVERTESDKTTAKNNARISPSGTVINPIGAVASAVGISPDEASKWFPARRNAKHLEMSATLPRRSGQQHQPNFHDAPSHNFRSGISHTSGNVSRRIRTQNDNMSFPCHDSLSRLKITWFVTNVICWTFSCRFELHV